MQAGAWLGKNVVVSFSKIDKRLEEAGFFKKLEPNPLPESVLDKDGDLMDECAEVRKASCSRGFMTEARNQKMFCQ